MGAAHVAAWAMRSTVAQQSCAAVSIRCEQTDLLYILFGALPARQHFTVLSPVPALSVSFFLFLVSRLAPIGFLLLAQSPFYLKRNGKKQRKRKEKTQPQTHMRTHTKGMRKILVHIFVEKTINIESLSCTRV